MNESMMEWSLGRATDEGNSRTTRRRRGAARAGLRKHFEEQSRNI
ncbi:MAG: hypothetical protein V4449_04090 [Patescibacteria group bacterium]